jgi:hypothetical protein
LEVIGNRSKGQMCLQTSLSRVSFALLSVVILTILSGCMYPKEQRKEYQVNPAEYIAVVQGAIDSFHEKTGVLPIKNSTMQTPIYEKYVIDFTKLQKSNQLSAIPANAFEMGGVFQYVLIDAETKPLVKLLDLAAAQAAGDVQKMVDDYKKSHSGNLPKGSTISPGIYQVNFDIMNKKQPQVMSTYNRQNVLQYLVLDSGIVSIDYTFDIMKIISDKGIAVPSDTNADLRDILVHNSYFVPTNSLPYHWINNAPVPSLK